MRSKLLTFNQALESIEGLTRYRLRKIIVEKSTTQCREVPIILFWRGSSSRQCMEKIVQNIKNI